MLSASNHSPSIGDEVEQLRLGIKRVGYVWYSDQLQILVKWNDGRSSSLRIGHDHFRIRERISESIGADGEKKVAVERRMGRRTAVRRPTPQKDRINLA
jgi:hypothetical protein